MAYVSDGNKLGESLSLNNFGSIDNFPSINREPEFSLFSSTESLKCKVPLNQLTYLYSLQNDHSPYMKSGKEKIRGKYKTKIRVVDTLSTEQKDVVLNPGLTFTEGLELFSYNPNEFKIVPGPLSRYGAHGVQTPKSIMYGDTRPIVDNGNMTVIAASPVTGEIWGTISIARLRLIDGQLDGVHELQINEDSSGQNRSMCKIITQQLEEQLKNQGDFDELIPDNITGWTLFALSDKLLPSQKLAVYKALLRESVALIDLENIDRASSGKPLIKASICTLQPIVHKAFSSVTSSLIKIEEAMQSKKKTMELARSYPLYWLQKSKKNRFRDNNGNEGITLEEALTNYTSRNNLFIDKLKARLSKLCKTDNEKIDFDNIRDASNFWGTAIDQMVKANGKGMQEPYYAFLHRKVQEIMSKLSDDEVRKIDRGSRTYAFALETTRQNLEKDNLSIMSYDNIN